MGLEVRIDGAAKLRLAAAQIKAVGDKPLGRRMSKALRNATKPLEAAVRAEADRVMPSGGGYRALFSRSLRFRNDVRTGARSASVRFRTYADGTKERRDVARLDAGQLRHPVYGRSRKRRRGPRTPNPWAVTTIRSGFHSRPTKDAGPLAEAEMVKVLDDLIDELKG